MANPEDSADDRAYLDGLIRGFQVSRMLRLVADIGVADHIGTEGRVAIDDVATACGVLAQPLIRVLRALAVFGIFSVSSDGTIGHTARSRLLRSDTPNSLGHSARFWAAPGSWAAWGKLDAAMTGDVPHVAAWNMERFAYLRAHPDEARGFDAMMANFPDNRHTAFAAAYAFPPTGLIADIGGGNGATLRNILGRFPQARGLLFDREDVVNAVKSADLLDGRITTIGGSFFDAVPSGADVYTMIRVLHNWTDQDGLKILRCCRAAMAAHAVLLIGEHVIDPVPTPEQAMSYLLDTQMMAMFGTARERTEAEFDALLSAAGLRLRRIMPTTSLVRIIEAVPA